MITIIKRFFDFVTIEPTRSPIGVMDMSTPTLKNSIPIINSVAPIKNVSRILGGIGAIEKHSKRTISKIGKQTAKIIFYVWKNYFKVL